MLQIIYKQEYFLYYIQNLKRIAEVWMDEYAQYVYIRNSRRWQISPGDLKDQIDLRNKLRCKSFDWYMRKIGSDILKYYPLIEPENFALGAIQSAKFPQLCINTLDRKPIESVELYLCDPSLRNPPRNQFWTFDWRKQIKSKDNFCLDVLSEEENTAVVLNNCEFENKNQIWKYDEEHKWIILVESGRCIECNESKRSVFVNECSENNSKMKWNIGYVNTSRLIEWNYNKS